MSKLTEQLRQLRIHIGPWYDHGRKAFYPFSYRDIGTNGKSDALAAAKVWAMSNYQVYSWAKTPYGSWMDAVFVKTRLAELKKRLAAGEVVMQ